MKQGNSESRELKPCPDCGGEAEVMRDWCGYYVECQKCGLVFGDVCLEDASGCFEPFSRRQEAIAAWNNEPRG